MRPPSARRYFPSSCRNASLSGIPAGTGRKISRRESAPSITIGWLKPRSDRITSREMVLSPAICLKASDTASALALPVHAKAVQARATKKAVQPEILRNIVMPPAHGP